jgi:D-alanine-D-alanine ligase
MQLKVTIIYNAPQSGRYMALGESLAEAGVLDEVNAVERALLELRHSVFLLPLNPPLEAAIAALKGIKADVVFNLFEGFDGEPGSEAAVAFALEKLGIPFTGCPGRAIALAQDKVSIAAFLEQNGIPTPHYLVLGPSDIAEFKLAFPCIVKPVGEHASHGLSAESVVHDTSALVTQVQRISARYSGKALVEEYIDGREFNATVMGNKELTVLPISEILFDLPPEVPKILTFAAKWVEGTIYFKGTKPFCPAGITDAEAQKIREMAMTIFRLAGCRGYARVDIRQDKSDIFRVIDINPNPDISPEAGVDNQRRMTGMTYPEFIKKVVALALKRR